MAIANYMLHVELNRNMCEGISYIIQTESIQNCELNLLMICVFKIWSGFPASFWPKASVMPTMI